MREIILSLAIAVIAYLLGCISTGLMISKRAGVDIRSLGSKNTGASNVLRVLGLRMGLVTFFGDALKAILACFAGSLLLPDATFGIQGYGAMIGGIFVVTGHNWPAFYGFKGGKGVACSAAVVLYINPLFGAIAIALCIIVIAITKYISLGSMTMMLTYAIMMCAFMRGDWFACGFSIVLLLMCLIRHRTNIKRLLNGTENKLGEKVDHQ